VIRVTIGRYLEVGARQFIDEAGRAWVAWNVTPDPRQGSSVSPGWIVFETTDGQEKRRLLAFPEGWDEMPELDLHALLALAGAVRPSRPARDRRLSADAGMQSPTTTSAAPPIPATLTPVTGSTGAASPRDRVVRSFRYPGGRVWSACVVKHPEGGGPPLLRFSAGARHLDLREWPVEWADYTDDGLVALVRSVPRPEKPTPRSASTPRRRIGDPRT
jgi:hypothetical protein